MKVGFRKLALYLSVPYTPYRTQQILPSLFTFNPTEKSTTGPLSVLL